MNYDMKSIAISSLRFGSVVIYTAKTFHQRRYHHDDQVRIWITTPVIHNHIQNDLCKSLLLMF